MLFEGAHLVANLLGRYTFDGLTYYDIADQLPYSISGPFTMMVTLRWAKLKKWSRIIDFGVSDNDNNIVVSSVGNDNALVFSVSATSVSPWWRSVMLLNLGVCGLGCSQ